MTVVGRVRQGMEILAALPRGDQNLGFYKELNLALTIISVRLASDVAYTERTHLEMFRTDTPLFLQLIEARRSRQEEWFHRPAGHIDIANIPLPVRLVTNK